MDLANVRLSTNVEDRRPRFGNVETGSSFYPGSESDMEDLLRLVLGIDAGAGSGPTLQEEDLKIMSDYGFSPSHAAMMEGRIDNGVSMLADRLRSQRDLEQLIELLRSQMEARD